MAQEALNPDEVVGEGGESWEFSGNSSFPLRLWGETISIERGESVQSSGRGRK